MNDYELTNRLQGGNNEIFRPRKDFKRPSRDKRFEENWHGNTGEMEILKKHSICLEIELFKLWFERSKAFKEVRLSFGKGTKKVGEVLVCKNFSNFLFY